MSLPKPPVALKGDCSAIYDNTLYSYSSAAFQSLILEEDAKWQKLPSGVSVEGGVCVGTTPADASQAGFYVVGGTAADGNYSGLQKFTYATKTWETITPNANVPVVNPNQITQNRRWHSATYLKASDELLIYAGSVDGVQRPSSATYAIKTTAPYQVKGYSTTDDRVSPAVAPLLLPWTDSQVVMIGGGATNKNIALFDHSTEWQPMAGASLASPLQDTTVLKGTILHGDDSSVHLYTFDATTSPTTVRRIMLMDGKGAPVANAVPVDASQAAASHSRRQLTASAWPQYNATYAPTAKRGDYSLAASPAGLMVLSGGSDDVLSIFDGKRNAWVNATHMFVGDQFVINSSPTPSATSSTVSITATSSLGSTASASISSTPTKATESQTSFPVSTDSSSTMPTTTILGVVLGCIFGLAALLFLILWCMKRARARRTHAEAGHARRASGYPSEKDYSQYNTAKATGPFVRTHQQTDSVNSFSSVAILMGKVQNPAVQRKASHDARRDSDDSIFNKDFKATIGKPQLQPGPQIGYADLAEDKEIMAAAARPAQPRSRNQQNGASQDEAMRRSSGWNKYWSGGNTLNVLGFGNKRQTVTSDGSQYSDMNRMTQDSATVPPLGLKVEGGPAWSTVNTGSPTVSQYNPQLHEHQGMSGKIEERPVSAVSALSSSGYTSGIPESIRDSWNPSDPKTWAPSVRAPSSMYSQATSYAQGGFQHTDAPPLPTSNNSRPQTGLSQQPQLAVAATSSDMSWLNLGNQNRRF